MRVIDFRIRLRTELMLKPWNPDDPMPCYEPYIDLYNMRERLTSIPMDDFVDNMLRQGVNQGVVCGGSSEENRHLTDIKNGKHKDKFYFVAGINPEYGISRNIEELHRITGDGFIGVNFVPYVWGVEANNKVLYPIYSYCEEHKLIAVIHGSLHYNRTQSMWLAEPKLIDEIAIHFPKLKIVVSHAFNGFGGLGLAVAQRHPNIYLEYSSLWPKYLTDVTLHSINTYLKKRSLFGTSYPSVDFSPAIDAWSEAIKSDVQELFFYQNALDCILNDPV